MKYSLDLRGIEEVNKSLKSVNIPDGNLTDVLTEIEISERTEGDQGGSRVASLEILDELLNLPVFRGQVSVDLPSVTETICRD